MDPDLWAAIRQLVRDQKLSYRTIAARLHVSRKTIKRALTSDTPPPARIITTKKGSKLDPYLPHIKRLLLEHPGIAAVRVREELALVGYDGGITILRQLVARLRPKLPPEPFLRIETPPGKEAQVDWASFGTIGEGNHARNLSCFVMVLSHSRMIYLEWTVSQRIDDFLRCHRNAFLFFGGIPSRILYDNPKTVVIQRVGRHIRFNDRFRLLADWYGYTPILCRPRRGNEKAKVERAIGYIRTSFFAGRVFSSLEDLNAQAIAWRDGVANRRTHRILRKRPIDLYSEERPRLLPFPANHFDCDTCIIASPSKDLFVVFDTNRYSVPASCAGASLRLRCNESLVRIYHRDALVASHPRSRLKHQTIQDPAHIDTVKDYKKMIGTSKRLDAFTSIGPSAMGFLKGLCATQSDPHFHVEAILEIARLHDPKTVDAAIARCSAHSVFDAAMVKHLIESVRDRKPAPPPVFGLFPDIKVASTNLADYDRTGRSDSDPDFDDDDTNNNL